MTHTAPLVPVVFTSSLLLWTAVGASILCPWTKVSPKQGTHYNFVRSVQSDDRSASPSERLYHSVWSAQRALLGCMWTDDAGLIQAYLSACRKRTHDFTTHQNGSFDLESLFATNETCVSLSSLWGAWPEKRARRRAVRSASEERQVHDERSEVDTHVRVKRGYLPPLTLWCGPGTMATSYSHLGVYAETDKCCREHDHCKYHIPPFQSAYGVWNCQMFTISHCDCDHKFRRCLMEAKEYVSDIIGNLYFNLLKVNCFKFPTCKHSRRSKVITGKAVIHSPACYLSTEERRHKEKGKKKMHKKHRH